MVERRMRAATYPTSTPRSSDEADGRAAASRRAADALLREHPDAMVFAQTSEGHIVPIPPSLGLDAYPVLASDGRTGVDLCVAEDRMTVVNAWMRLKREAVAEARARLRTDPEQWRTVRMLDLRRTHGVVLSVVWASARGTAELDGPPAATPASTAPRFCTRKQDKEGNVIECDDAYLQMFGYATSDDVVGQPTFERVHPDDQARLIESWIAMVATGRVQMARVRAMRGDGSWLWVDTTYHNYLDDGSEGYVLAECIDVSAEMAAQEALQDREELLRRLLEEMPDGVLQLNGERTVVYCNVRLLEILGVPPAVAPSADDLELDAILNALTGHGRRAFDEAVARAYDESSGGDVEVEAFVPSGEHRYVLVKVRPLVRHSGVVSGIIASVQDVTDSTRERRELEQRASVDALTGCHNRASIIAALTASLNGLGATGVIFIDLDRFKSINDRHGHAAGDEVLAGVAERVQRTLRAGDVLGRLGGDEFLVVLRDVQDPELAMAAGARIRRELCSTIQFSFGAVETCASIGVAHARSSATSAQELIERADAAMYQSKHQRRGAPVLAPAS